MSFKSIEMKLLDEAAFYIKLLHSHDSVNGGVGRLFLNTVFHKLLLPFYVHIHTQIDSIVYNL